MKDSRHALTLAISALTLAAGLGVGFWWGHGRVTTPAAAPAAMPAPERKVLYWHDPMVPSQRFDKPGKSPFMDMDLVPVYADESSGEATVNVAPGLAQNLGIRLGSVESRPWTSRLTAVGSVAFDDELLRLVPARVDGTVVRLHVHAPLELVRQGQPLAELLAPQWLEAEQEYLALLDLQSSAAESLRAAARQRLAVLGVPEETIRSVQATRHTQATTTVLAPIDGVVTELGEREGASFMAGATLFRINGLATVWVNAQVPEAQVAAVSQGAKVIARATAWPGIDFPGRVIARLPQLDAETRTVPVRVAMANAKRQLAPGMFVTLEFASETSQPTLTVPTEAVIATGERSVIIVASSAHGYQVRDVKVGREENGRSEILSGLASGERVVLSGQFLLDSEASLKAAATRLQPAGMEPKP